MRTGPASFRGFSKGKVGSESRAMVRPGLEREETGRQRWSDRIKKVTECFGEVRVRVQYHMKTCPLIWRI